MIARYTRATWAAADEPREMLEVAVGAGVARPVVVATLCALARVWLGRGGRRVRELEDAAAWCRGEGRDAIKALSPHADRRIISFATYPAWSANASLGTHADALVGDVIHKLAGFTIDDAWYVPLDRYLIYYAACAEAKRRMADVVRAHIPWPTLAKAYARG